MANKKVTKTFGEFPEKVVVGSELIEFDEKGEASVEAEIAEKLEQIPGYEVAGVTKAEPKKEEAPKEQEPSEDEKPAPKKPAPKKPAPKKA